jgi:hypothetical protein
MTTNQAPEMMDELLRVTTPAQPRLDYETLRARYEFLCQNIHKLRAEIHLHADGRAEIHRLRFLLPGETWQNLDFALDAAEMDAKVAEVMKGRAP